MALKLRRGTAVQWAAANPILAEGEQGFERDTGKFKIGDGVTAWNSDPNYYISVSAIDSRISTKIVAESPVSTVGADPGEVPIWDSVTGRFIPGPVPGGVTAGALLVVNKDVATGYWPASWSGLVPSYVGGSASSGVRPTSSANVCVMWKGPDPSPAVVSSGVGGMRDMTGGALGDLRFVTP